MDKFKRYSNVILFVTGVVVLLVIFVLVVMPKYTSLQASKADSSEVSQKLETLRTNKQNIENKLKKLKNSIITSQKKVYSPIEDKLGNDTLFFTLYNDVIEMVHANAVKIKSIDYQYNPAGDIFVEQGSLYFVCDVNMEIVSNYTNLGKLIQDIYQYPYYIKINQIEVYPYPKDKKILLTKISLRLYSHTSPEDIIDSGETAGETTIEGASTPIPQ